MIYCTPKCFVGRELKPCYCNHLNPHADRNIHPDPVTIRVPYRLYWAFSFQCNLFSETEMITRCVKTYQVLKYLSLLVTKQHNITQKNTMIYFWCLMTDFAAIRCALCKRYCRLLYITYKLKRRPSYQG